MEVLSLSSGLARRALVISALPLIFISSCGQSDEVAPPTNDASGQSFSLYTHCGNDELRVDGKFYERVGGPLDDGSGNPPKGWDNPYQAGQLSVRGNGVVFTDDRGHHEEFELRADATDYKRICS
jgi:hypothetical protein